MVGPWITFVSPSAAALGLDLEEEDSMSDIQYLSVKEFDSKLRTNEGAVTTTGTLATLTAATGKDMYLASAKVNLKRSDIAVVGQADLKVELQMNAVVIATWDANVIWNTDLVNISNDYEFKVGIGKKVLTGQVIRLEVISNTGNDANVEGAIACFEEDTGTTPRLAPQSVGSVTVTAGLAGDVGFLAKKEFDGKLVLNEGVLATTGTLCTLTASSGKDLYLSKASFTVFIASAPRTLKIELQANGVVQETFITEFIDNNADGVKDFVFSVSGIKVAATEVLKLEITTNDNNNASVEGTITGWEEDTGTSPA